MIKMNLPESYGLDPIKGAYKTYRGELEFEIKDTTGRIIEKISQPNIVKIFAKEILSHRLCHSKIWDPTGGTGSGAWSTNDIDIDELSVKYICFGASFDTNGTPLDQPSGLPYQLLHQVHIRLICELVLKGIKHLTWRHTWDWKKI
jgi:hypothetical protein